MARICLLFVLTVTVTGPERGGGSGGGALPARLAIVTDRGKSCREQGNLVVKEAVAAVMIGWGSPFWCAQRFGGHVTSLTERVPRTCDGDSKRKRAERDVSAASSASKRVLKAAGSCWTSPYIGFL